MASVTTLKITEEGLKNYAIKLDTESNERFFNDFLYPLTGRERDKLFGYNPKVLNSVGKSSDKVIRTCKYPAFRIRLMCQNSGGNIDPNDIRRNYNHVVECKSRNLWFVVDKNTENAVWDAICDGI